MVSSFVDAIGVIGALTGVGNDERIGAVEGARVGAFDAIAMWGLAVAEVAGVVSARCDVACTVASAVVATTVAIAAPFAANVIIDRNFDPVAAAFDAAAVTDPAAAPASLLAIAARTRRRWFFAGLASRLARRKSADRSRLFTASPFARVLDVARMPRRTLAVRP
jgi:hypothetical protein